MIQSGLRDALVKLGAIDSEELLFVLFAQIKFENQVPRSGTINVCHA